MIALEEADGIVDLVGYAGGELADRGQLLVLDHERLRLLELQVGLGQLEVGPPELALALYPLADILDDALELQERSVGAQQAMGRLQAEDGAAVSPLQDDLVILDISFLADSAKEELPVGSVEGEARKRMADDLVLLGSTRQNQPGRVDRSHDVVRVGRIDHVARVLEEDAKPLLVLGEEFLGLAPDELRARSLDAHGDYRFDRRGDGRERSSCRTRPREPTTCRRECSLPCSRRNTAPRISNTEGNRRSREGPGPEPRDA